MAATQKFTNSALVSYTKLSPNHSGKRTHNIDTIAIHCMAGNCSIETCGNIFASSSRQASSNYGIGSDGRIGMYVEEKNRSWCTSSAAVDQRAVTIEVANNGGGPSWPVSEKAMASLINLIVDIIKRNPDINELKWEGNKALIGNVARQNMVVHQWTAPKTCLPLDITELLTKEGWKYLKDIKLGEEVMSVNINDMKGNFSPVQEIVDPRLQDTYEIDKLETTIDHRIVFYDRFLNRHIGFMSDIFEVEGISLPATVVNQTPGLPLFVDLITLIVAIRSNLSYLYEDDGKTINGIKLKFAKYEDAQRIIALMEAFDYKSNIETFDDFTLVICKDQELIEIIKTYIDGIHFKWNMIDMNYLQAKYFIKELVRWNGNMDEMSYIPIDDEDKDLVMAVAAINGNGVSFDKHSRTIKFSAAKRKVNTKSMIQHDPKLVSCVTVESGFILIRQNGNVTVVGNCPGNYLYNKHPYIVQQVNARLKATGSTVTGTPTAQKPNAIGDSNEKKLWKFLASKHLNDFAIAGIMGNLFAESGLEPNNLQNAYEKKLGYSDEAYTKAVDNRTYKNFTKDSAGYGLAQWTYWSRKEALLKYAKATGKSIGDLQMQMEYLWKEMQGYPSMLTKLATVKSVKEASDLFMTQFERPADMSESAKAKRASYGDSFYKKNADKDSNRLPYKVKVNDGALNIRKGPGTNNPVVGCIRDNGIYTIIEESAGTGAKKWGKLKSGAGWISLDFCIKTS